MTSYSAIEKDANRLVEQVRLLEPASQLVVLRELRKSETDLLKTAYLQGIPVLFLAELTGMHVRAVYYRMNGGRRRVK